MAIYFEGKQIHVSELFCDKLTFTIDYYHKYEQNHIEKEIEALGPLAKPYRRRPYKYGARIYLGEYPNQMCMLIQWKPIFTDAAYLRVDLNPRYADMDHVYALLSAILPGGLADVQLKARITRFDASVDLTGISPDQFLAYAPGKQISRIYCKSGRTETMYLGGYESGNTIVIYDKQLEIKEMNNKNKTSIPVPTDLTTRVELRLHPGLSVAELFHVESPFQDLVIRPFSPYPEVDTETWRLFIALAQFRGAHDAMKLLEKSTRDIFKKKIESVICGWWDPASIWSTWGELLEEVFILQPGDAKSVA